ncbi:MAG: gluconeogenesis factor YvcK family protein [Planctomycetota bacterium]
MSAEPDEEMHIEEMQIKESENLSSHSCGYMPRIVAFGGGTGLSTILRGLKLLVDNITAVVTVCDDGGSSGRIRKDFGILAPGDIRNCLVALADTEPLMEELLQYRFEESDLEGHSFGNLLLTALTRITGDFGSAIKEANKILKVKGKVLPSTLDRVTLVAIHEDGTKSTGEIEISRSRKPIKEVMLKPLLGKANQEVLDAISQADLLVFGPGSLYTSVIPNLLAKDVVETASSSRAKRVYLCNIMTQPGETSGYQASDHVRVILEHTTPDFLDYVIVNTGEVLPHIAEKYSADGSYPVYVDRENLEKYSYELVEIDLVSRRAFARHDSTRTAALIMELIVSSLNQASFLHNKNDTSK